MNHLGKTLKAVVLGVPIAITFVDSVGYVARVDGKIDRLREVSSHTSN